MARAKRLSPPPEKLLLVQGWWVRLGKGRISAWVSSGKGERHGDALPE